MAASNAEHFLGSGDVEADAANGECPGVTVFFATHPAGC